jgi:hypothetical protein
MNENRGTLEVLADELAILLSPLTSMTPTAGTVFLKQLGLVLDDAQIAGIVPALTQTIGGIGQLISLDFDMNASIDAGDSGAVITKRIAALDQVVKVIAGFEQLRTALAALALPPEAGPIIADLPARLFNYLLALYVERSRGINELLEFAGVLERTDMNVGVFDPAKPFFTIDTYHLDRIGKWLSDPSGQLAGLYDWGKPGFDGTKLLPIIERAAGEFGLPALLDTSQVPPLLDLIFLGLVVRTDVNPPGVELRLNDPLSKGALQRTAVKWTATLSLDTNVPADTSLLIQPGSLTILSPEATKPAGIFSLLYSYVRQASDPLMLLSLLGAGRITVEEVDASAALSFGANGAAQLALSADVKRGRVRIGTDGADGFIAKILAGFQLDAAFDLGLGYSAQGGLHFRGSSALQIELASHMTLGPVSVDALTLTIGIQDGKFPIAVTADLGTSFGPLTATVQGLGFEADIGLAGDNKGNAGPLDVQARFRPPNGVALGMDGGGFKGGGFLIFDQDRGEYGGGLELDFLGIVTITAVGLLSTKFPDGHRGFSLVIIISADFPPIQLGFGFTLIGVGGLLGLSRTVDEDVLREGVHQGALDSVLFPHDVAANARRIVNDLQRLFPPAEDHFLIGPMVQFGWGTPTILSLEFGFVLDIPRPAFFILGRLRIGLPFQDLALFDVRVTFAGGVDFSAGQLWFDGTLYDSRLLTFPLTGDMAVRLYWKDNANFVLTCGGFHPAYTPPPMGFGTLQRLGITLFDGNPRLRSETYLAITSNTVQWGAKSELFFGIDAFNIYGFIGYDVLIQFDPFRFVATLSAMLAVRSGSEVLMSIRVDALVEGPTPWHAKGTGTFEISLIISITIDVDFEVTLGESRHDTLPPIDVLPQLAIAFADANNWRAALPSGANLQVSLRAFDAAPGTLVLHPFGSLDITEKLVPLNLPVQKLGTQRIADGPVFRVEHVLLGGAPGQLAPLREQFAPAQYIDMSDAQKLSSRSFENYEAGVQVGGGDAINADHSKGLSVEYEVIYIPEHRERIFFRLAQFLFNSFVRGSAVSQSSLSAAQTAPSVLGARNTQIAPEQFAVASALDLTLHADNMLFSSEAEARAAMNQAVARDPSLTNALQVVPSYLARAA